MRRRAWLAMSWVMLSGLLGAHACGGRTDDVTAVNNDSESHFLASCHAGGCPEGLSCVLGVCTQTCGADAECTVWSPNAVCRPEPTSGGSDICDVECDTQTECAGLGAAFDCTNGVCRAADARAVGEFFRGCVNDSCSEGLSCISGQCTQPCRRDADCGFAGASCEVYFDAERAVSDYHCVLPCEGGLAASLECASLGSGGRCLGGECREVFGGQCGDLGRPGAEWACYEDIAADVFRERHAGLLDDEVCLPARDARAYDVDYRLCGETTCAGGASGCAVAGLVLETQPLAAAEVDAMISGVWPVVAATGEVRLREPMNVRIELPDPVERCEYSMALRFWDLQLLDGYTYLSASDAAFASSSPENPFEISADAVQSGLWQATHDVSLRHLGRSVGVGIEDSELDIELLSGGERCTTLQSLIGVRVRLDLVDVIRTMLDTWARGVEDTLECLPCGALNCELACRHR
jgi:hypothetical protein